MYSYDISDVLKKKLLKLAKRDKVLAGIFYKKVQEIITRDDVGMYKNLRSPLQEYKRIHLTDNYILLFIVQKTHIIFIDIKHWDAVFS